MTNLATYSKFAGIATSFLLVFLSLGHFGAYDARVIFNVLRYLSIIITGLWFVLLFRATVVKSPLRIPASIGLASAVVRSLQQTFIIALFRPAIDSGNYDNLQMLNNISTSLYAIDAILLVISFVLLIKYLPQKSPVRAAATLHVGFILLFFILNLLPFYNIFDDISTYIKIRDVASTLLQFGTLASFYLLFARMITSNK